MFGKHFASMYEGSMYGAGIAVFAVWGYVIANCNKGAVELNPKKLADTLGGTMQEVTEAIQFLERPDEHSRFKEYGGRRLVKEGEFQYRVPSWEFYRQIRNEDERREYNRKKQAEYRAKKGLRKQHPLNGENAYVRKLESQGQEAADKSLS